VFEHGVTLIHFAVILRRYDVLNVLFSEESNIEQQQFEFFTQEDIRGLNPLHLAYIINDSPLIQYLEQHLFYSTQHHQSNTILQINPIELQSIYANLSKRNKLNISPPLLKRFLYETGQYNLPNFFQIPLFDQKTKQMKYLTLKQFEEMFSVRYIQHSLFSLSYLRYLLTTKLPTPIGDSVKNKYKVFVDSEMQILSNENNTNRYINKFILCKINDKIGYGLFAGRCFNQHEYLTFYCGILEESKTFEEFDSKDQKKTKTYNICTVLKSIVINASTHRNLSAFINSSYHPNAYLRGYFDHGQPITILVSLVPIQKGEQITFAYDCDGSWFQSFGIEPQEMMNCFSEDGFPRRIGLSEDALSTENRITTEGEPLWTCGHCYRTEKQIQLSITCSDCQYFKFCSEHCHQQAKYHQLLCSRLSQLRKLQQRIKQF
jgi:hypothetical protein